MQPHAMRTWILSVLLLLLDAGLGLVHTGHVVDRDAAERLLGYN
jgi:hypothetical protein